MEPRYRSHERTPRMRQEDFPTIAELNFRLSNGKTLTPGEKERVRKDAEATRKRRRK